MMRSDSEIKLLQVWQRVKDALHAAKGAPVISLRGYQQLRVQDEVCRELVAEERRFRYFGKNQYTKKEKA